MEGGWIRLHRQLENHWIAENNDYFHWWVDMLWMAAFQGYERDGVTIKRGQFEASVSFLTKRWLLNRKTLDRKTVINFLKRLESEQMITRIVTDGKKAIITICNYDKYQYSLRLAADTSLDTIMDTLTDIKTDTIKRIIKELNKKLKSSKEDLSGTPPDTKITEEQINFESLLTFWNKTMETANAAIPQLGSMTEKRKASVRARAREHGKRAVFEVINKASTSDWLNGKNKESWIANFDWIFRPNNFPKVLEGNYDNKIATNQINQNYGSTNTNRVGYVDQRKAEREQLARDYAATIARRLAEDDERASGVRGQEDVPL